MNYAFFQYKTIHFDNPEALISPGFFESNLIPHYEISAKTEKDQLPVLIRWTFRISRDCKNVFSCIGDRADHWKPKIKTDLSFDELIAKSVGKKPQEEKTNKKRNVQ